MNRVFVSLAICSALLLAGCGGGKKQSAPAQAAPAQMALAQMAPTQAAPAGDSSTQAIQQQITNLQKQGERQTEPGPEFDQFESVISTRRLSGSRTPGPVLTAFMFSPKAPRPNLRPEAERLKVSRSTVIKALRTDEAA